MKAGNRYPSFHYVVLSASIPITLFKALRSTILYSQMKEIFTFTDEPLLREPLGQLLELINRCTVNWNFFLQPALRYAMWVELYPYSVLTLALDSVSGQSATLRHLSSAKSLETIWSGDETGYICLESNLQNENPRMSLYCKMSVLNVTNDLTLSLRSTIFLSRKIFRFLPTPLMFEYIGVRTFSRHL